MENTAETKTEGQVVETKSPAEVKTEPVKSSRDELAIIQAEREKRQLSKRIKELESKVNPFEQLRETAKKDPIAAYEAALQHLGVTPAQLYQLQLDAEEGDDPAAKRINELQARLDAYEKRIKEDDEEAENAWREDKRSTAKETLVAKMKADERFELVAQEDPEEVMAEAEKFILLTLEELDGDVSKLPPNIDEMFLKLYDDLLQEKADRLAKTKRMAKKFQTAPTGRGEEEEDTGPDVKRTGTKTLSNGRMAATPDPKGRSKQRESEERSQRFAELMRLMPQ